MIAPTVRRLAWWRDAVVSGQAVSIPDSQAIRQTSSRWWQRNDASLLGLAAALVISSGVGAVVANGLGLPLAGAMVLAAAAALAIHNWRWSVYGLLLYLPFAGIPVIALYPNTQIPVLVKDFLFTLPAYLGFVLTTRRPGWAYKGAPMYLLGALVVLVCAEIFNPSSPRVLIGLIGAKVWLLYIPLLFLGYHLISTRHQLARLLKILTLVALIPAAIGILEAVLFHTAYRETVYGFYGKAVLAVTQRFAHTDYDDGGLLLRVPSTFSFVTQYYVFAASMVALSLATWRMRGRRWWAVPWAVMILACATSGARGAFLMMPLLIVIMLALEGNGIRTLFGRAAMPLALGVGGLLLAFSIFGSSAGTVLSHALWVGNREFDTGFIQTMSDALQSTRLGLGTGMNTEAARYAFDSQADVQYWGGLANESWWVKVVQELGLAGLAIVGCLFATMIHRALKAHRTLKDPALRAVSAVLLGFLIWNMVYLVKGMYIDTDPLNVYFWLFAGILAKIPSLETAL